MYTVNKLKKKMLTIDKIQNWLNLYTGYTIVVKT